MSITQIGSARVDLSSWELIKYAAQQGLLDERTHCELKKGPDPRNDEIACDLASLTIEGGLLIYGIVDAGRGLAGDVVGVIDPEDLKTRLIAIAAGKVQPSMVCEVRVVVNPGEPTRGCVLVEVPVSALAPHRATDRYWGRSSEGKRLLSDLEVGRYFSERRNLEDTFVEELTALAETFDPVPSARQSHLFFASRVLQPTSVGPPWRGEHPLHLINAAGLPNVGWGGADLNSLTHWQQHPRGVLVSSEDPASPSADEDRAIKLLIRDDGAMDCVCTFASRHFPVDEQDVEGFALGTMIVLVDQLVRLTGQVAHQLGSTGTWRLGVHIQGLRGLRSAALLSRFDVSRAVRYPEDTYLQVADVTSRQPTEHPQEVVGRLMQSLARGFNVEHAFPYEHPQDMYRRPI